MCISAYNALLLWLQHYGGGQVPLSIILGTRLLLLVPFITTQLRNSSLEQTWVTIETIYRPYGLSEWVLASWGILYLSTGSFTWDEANSNPAMRTLAYDLTLSILSTIANGGLWDKFP